MAIHEMICFPRTRIVHRLLIAAVFLIVLFIYVPRSPAASPIDLGERERRYPLAWKHIHLSGGTAGAWYIPPSWLPAASTLPKNLVDVARLASKIASQEETKHYLNQTNIPRILHQTWKGTNLALFPEKTLEGIEKWLAYATAPESEMAYFLWDDSGVRDFLKSVETGYTNAGEKLELADILPKPVELADVFRVVVCNTIGGVYADIDTIPLRSPTSWVETKDIADWTDPATGITYGQHGTTNESYTQQNPAPPVALILGIEADVDENSDSYWRMGYSYPVQLTQWSLAASPKQPVLDHFLANFRTKVQGILDNNGGGDASLRAFKKQDPLELTGPAAITKATKEYLGAKTGLRWQGLSGIKDGGRSKVVLDTLILPITGFSPGRARYGNMGSKPLTDLDARVQHAAQGSWRKFNLKVEMGKACRTIFGMCKDWSKVE